MDKEQLAIFLKDNRESTAEAIRLTVNGKIDHLTARTVELQSFMENHAKDDKDFQSRIEPYIEGANGIIRIRDFAVWIGGGLIAFGVIKDLFI